MLRENVRISEVGYSLLNDKELAEKVAQAILNGKEQLKKAGEIKVANSNLSIHLVTSFNDAELSNKKVK